MDNYTFKTVAFGGFDKQDVIHYIEQTSKETAERQDQLQQENESLQTEAERLRSQLRELQTRLDTETALREEAQERLRPEAEAYAQFRDRVGDIECDAHKRAAELEASTLAKLRRTVDLFRAQYTALMSAFETTAAQVTVELRKVEVNLSQLPRAMDQAGTELNELAALLEQRADPEKKKLLNRVFGADDQSCQGAVTFLQATPTNDAKIVVDITNVHTPKYYRTGKISDLWEEKPTPI